MKRQAPAGAAVSGINRGAGAFDIDRVTRAAGLGLATGTIFATAAFRWTGGFFGAGAFP